MSEYKFFIYKVAAHASAAGEYVGPFATEQERDDAAREMRSQRASGARRQSVYRANVEEELAARLGSPSIVAA